MKQINVLLADDHHIVIDGIMSFLEKEDEINVVAFAHNGLEVLDILASKKIDVAVLDIQMPGMDGLETTKKILLNHPNCKILLLTMHSEGDFIVQSMRLGAHGYVIKEKSKETLVGAIHSVSKGQSFWPPELIAKISNPALLLKKKEDEKEVNLTPREKQVLSLTGEAFSAKEIAIKLDLSEATINTYWRNLREKLQLPTVQALVRYAILNGFSKERSS